MKMKGILGRGQGKDLTKSKKISKMGLSSDAEVLEGVYLPLGVFTSTDWSSKFQMIHIGLDFAETGFTGRQHFSKL